MHKTTIDGARFLGRDADLEQIQHQLFTEKRVVVLTGPAGIGKTTLARHLAANLCSEQDTHRELTWCDLSFAREARDLASEVAASLGVVVSGLTRALTARKGLLLCLDGTERAAAATASLLETWTENAPRLQVIVTSRLPLPSGEFHHHNLAPLTHSQDAGVGNDAMRLLLQEGRRAGFRATPADQPHLLALVRALDGNPLALTLAGARLGVLGPRQLLERLPAGLEILSEQGSISLQQSIDATVGLLHPNAQRALKLMGVFRGGFDVEALSNVAELPFNECLDAVTALKQASLLQVDAGLKDGERRLSLHEMVRVFARRSLEQSGELDAALTRHAQYYIDAGHLRAQAHRDGRCEESWRWLRSEQHNLNAAEEHVRTKKLSPTLQLKGWLARFPVAYQTGCAPEVLGQIELPLDACSDAALLAETFGTLAILQCDAGQREVSSTSFRRGLEHAPDPSRLQASLLKDRAVADFRLGRLQEARQGFTRGQDVARSVGATQLAATCLHNLACAARLLGEVEAAVEYASRSLELQPASSPSWGTRALLGTLRVDQGRFSEAESLLRRCVDAFREFGRARQEADSQGTLGCALQLQDDLDGAQECYERARLLHHQLGRIGCEGMAVGMLGDLDVERKQHKSARLRYLLAIDLAVQGVDRWCEALNLARLGLTERTLGQIEASNASFDRAARAITEVGDPALERTLSLHRAHSQLLEQAGPRSSETELPELGPSATTYERFARRWLDRERTRLREAEQRKTWAVDPNGTWFRPPDSERIDIASRRAPRRILEALASKRFQTPAGWLTAEEILEAGWPAEKILPEARNGRVHVAISTLRKLGLRELLQSSPDGYRLDPAETVAAPANLPQP